MNSQIVQSTTVRVLRIFDKYCIGFKCCAFFKKEEREKVYNRAKKLSVQKREVPVPDPYYIEEVKKKKTNNSNIDQKTIMTLKKKKKLLETV